MNILKSLELTKEYAICPKCGNENVGNGEGVLRIEEDTFFRACKCGWSVSVEGEGIEE
ncbi:DUF3797 domain-containing protein [Paenibacillus polymyxa]|uniref:DUF3797 domain-containing protein n=2 Tax=Paenibacillus TaxID=44249 RepID=UPI002ED2ABED|nr:DUF3797 domain-containing protein [Paenibacillus polymyxa]